VALLAEIISKVNDLFDGDLTEGDKLVYVNSVLKGKLLESETLVQQAQANTKRQFEESPNLDQEILYAVMDSEAAFSTMSKQALDSDEVRQRLEEMPIGPAALYEALQERGQAIASTWRRTGERPDPGVTPAIEAELGNHVWTARELRTLRDIGPQQLKAAPGRP
jgi:hypothetical protein